MTMPLISVIIPTHNRPELLRRALRSVLAQTFEKYEVIVVDDGDDDAGVQTVLASFGDSRLRYVAQETRHGGAPKARNRGVQEAQAQVVAFLDDDDEWLPEKLAKQYAALMQNEEAVAAFTGTVIFDEKGKSLGERWPREEGLRNVFERTLYRPYIWTSALAIRKESFNAVEGFDETFPKNQEWDLALRLGQLGPFYAIDELLVRLNVQGDDEHLGGKGNIANIIKGHEMLLAKHAEAYAKYPKARARVAFILFGLYREAGNFEGMQRALRIARKAQPWNDVYLRHAVALALGPHFYFRMFKKSYERAS